MEVPPDDREECQKPQIKDAALCANMSNIHTTGPVNSQSSRRFRARSCKASKPAEKITIDLTEDDNNDTTIPCTENQSNDQIVHIDDACDKDENRPDVAISKVVKVTSFQVPKVDVQELHRGSDMHEFLLCLGSNVLKDITCNGGRALVNTSHKVRTSITENYDLPVGRLEKNPPCFSGWDDVNDHPLAATTTETPHGILSNRPTKDSSIDDGWGLPNQDPCNADGQEKTNLNQNSWISSGEVDNTDTFWGISSQNTPHDDGWGNFKEDTCKVTGQKSTLCQTSWSGANGIENRDTSRDRKRNCLDWTRSEIEGKNEQVSSMNDIHGDKMKEDERRSGKYAPSGSNLVPLGKRKIMVNRPDREDPCDNGWDVINDNTDCIDTWKGVDKCHRAANPSEDSPGQWAGKLENRSLSDDGWGMASKDVCNDTAQEKYGKKIHSDDGWGMPIEDLGKATVDDGWGMLSDDLGKSTKQDKKALIQMPWSATNTNESRDILSQGSELPNADTEITTRNPLDFVSSERREQKEMSSSMNDSDGDNMNVDRRRSGKYAPSGANLVPLGKRKTRNGPVMRDPCASGWTSINDKTACTNGWEVSDKANKVTDLTTENPSWSGRLETDLPCDDGWGPMNEDCNASKESLCGSWGGTLEKDSCCGSLWGNATASEDQHEVTTQETMNLIHSPWSAKDDIMNRDKSLYTPRQGSEVADLDPTNTIQNSSDCGNLERKGQIFCESMSDTFGNKMKRTYPENDNDEERRSGRYEPSGANLVPLGKRDGMLNRRYRYLWDQSTCPTEPSEAFNAVKTLASSMRKILHQSRYAVGDKLSPEDQKEVFDNALLYHPDKDNKIGCGVDYITIDTHPEYQNAQCFFIVRKDGSRSDFSYWKCIKGFVQDKYPDHANEIFELFGLL